MRIDLRSQIKDKLKRNFEKGETGIMERQTVPNGIHEKVVALLGASTIQKLENGVSSCDELLAGYKEARVVLIDLKYTDKLSQEQRRDLVPKRRRTSSITSQRTKNLLKEIAKEEAVAWMDGWTSSSVESVSFSTNENKSKSKRGKGQSKRNKKVNKSEVCIKQEKDPDEPSAPVKQGKKKKYQGATRPVGRPRKNVIELGAPQTPSVITVSSISNTSADGNTKNEKDLRLNPINSVAQIGNQKDMRLNIMNPKAQEKSKLIISRGRGRRTRKETRKSSKTNNLKRLCETFLGDENSEDNQNNSKQSLHKKIKQEILSPPVKVKKEFTGNHKLEISQKMQIEDSNKSGKTTNNIPLKQEMSPSLKPFHKSPCNLDHIDQIIEEVVAAGRSPSPLENYNALSSEKLEIPKSANPLKGGNSNDSLASRTERSRISDSRKLQNGGLDVSNVSIGSSGSTQSCGSGKRKMPEIIQDSVLPRGTIDIPSVRPKTPCHTEKRRKIVKSEFEIWKNSKPAKNALSLPNNCQTVSNSVCTTLNQSLSQPFQHLNKFHEIELTKDSKFSSSQPEISSNLNAKVLAIDKNNRYWDDALNNNQSGATIDDNRLQKSNDELGLYSSLRLTPSPHSNVTDEANALSDLLSKPCAIDGSFVDVVHGPNENLQNYEPPRIVHGNEEIPNRTKQIEKAKPIEKLTTKNLDRFNNPTLGNQTPDESTNSTLLAQSRAVSKQVEAENGHSDWGSIGSGKSRKRKWVPDESKTESGTEKNKMNGNRRLVRKHWENQGKWVLDKPGSSSIGSEPHPRLSESKTSGKPERSLITGPTVNRVRVETANRKINNNLQKVDKMDDVLQKSDVDTSLPGFGEPAVVKIATPESSSSTMESSSSGSSSSSRDSSSSSSRSSDSNPPASGPRTMEQAPKIEEESKKSKCMKDFKIPLLSKKDDAGPGVVKINNGQMPPKKAELRAGDTKSIDKNIHPVTIDSETQTLLEQIDRHINDEYVEPGLGITKNIENSRAHRIEIRRNSDEIKTGTESNKIQPIVDVGRNEEPNNSKHWSEDELEELCDAETLARKKNTAGSVKETEAEEEEEEDCISLDTESLCMSGIVTPPLHELSKSSKLPSGHEGSQVVAAPVAPEPYARMKSSNIGNFVAANVRECEESFEVLKDNAVIADSTFDGSTGHRDLRTTLNSRMISRDIPALFRGKCFAWLRTGICKSRTCRFTHTLEPRLGDIQKYDLKNIEEIITYAANQSYCNFIDLVLNKAMTNMTTSQIKCLYYQLYKKQLLTITHIEKIIDALRIRRFTSTDVIAALTEFVSPVDVNIRVGIQLAIHKKVEPDRCWNVLAKLIAQAKPPVTVIETIMEETIRKNCKDQAHSVYENVLKRLTVQEAKEISADLWDKFNKLNFPNAPNTTIAPIQNPVPDTDFASGLRNNISPESPKSERVHTPVDQFSIKSPSIEPATVPHKIHQPPSTLSRGSQSRSSSDFEDTSYNLQPIDKLPPAKCPYRDYLWKFHWDLQGMQEGLKHKDYAHVISILKHYAAYPNRLPHIEGFYNILIKEITSAKHHLDEIVRLTVQSGSSDQLRLYVYDLGIYVVTKLADNGAWIHAYELLKTFQVYGSYNTCAFTLLAAQIYIANRRPSKALDLLEKSRIVCTNGRKWRQIQCKEDEHLRATVLDLLLYSLCDGHVDDALRLLDFILRDQCSIFKPINLIPHVERIVRLLLAGKRISLIIDVGRLILQAKLFVSAETFRGLINRVFHEDLVLAKQLHRYATWLGAYNKAKINTTSCVHMVINIDWTEEETFLMISSLLEDLCLNIGHAISRMKIRQLNVFLIFEAIPTEQELTKDVSSDGLLSAAALNKRRATVKSVLDRFDPKIRMIKRHQGRISKLQSQSLIAYLQSGHVTF